MPARTPLTDAEIEAALPAGWRRQPADGSGDGRSAIERTFTFGDFREAFAFLTRVAFEAEAMDHHPHVTNVYDRVTLALSTHDADNRVTETDLVLAARINALDGG